MNPSFTFTVFDDQARTALVREITAAVTETLQASIKQSPRLVDGIEMARICSVSEVTISRFASNRRIPSVKIGSRRLFDPDAVIVALSSQQGDDDA